MKRYVPPMPHVIIFATAYGEDCRKEAGFNRFGRKMYVFCLGNSTFRDGPRLNFCMKKAIDVAPNIRSVRLPDFAQE